MLKRPLILKLFALFLCIDPLLRISFIAIEREFPFFSVLEKSFALSPGDFFNFWFLFPISGLLVLSVKLYSYLIFISIQFYSLYFHLSYEPYSWPYLSKHPSSTAYLLLGINMMITLYLLLPRTREIFFNKDLRWWERGSRYTINEPCSAKFQGKEIHGKVCDISFGGALLQLDTPVPANTEVDLLFEVLGKNVRIKAEIVRIINVDGGPKFGCKFLFKGLLQKLQLKFIMFSITKIGGYEKFR